MTTVSGGTYYYSHDGLGSVRTLTTSNGSLTNTYDYTPFGAPIAQGTPGQVTQRYTYTGRESSPHAAAPMYYRIRMLTPTTARFLNRNPWGMIHREAGQLYDYVSNNPVLYAEPYSWEWFKGAVGGALRDAANYVMLGETDPSQEKVEAFRVGYVKHFGLGVGAWVWTGEWNPNDEKIDAVINGGQRAIHQSLDCAADCFYCMNKKVTVWLAGGLAGAGTWTGVPKPLADLVTAGKGNFFVGGKGTIKSTPRFVGHILKHALGPKNSISKWFIQQGTAFKRSGKALRAAKVGIAAVAITETAIAIYCADLCSRNPCFSCDE